MLKTKQSLRDSYAKKILNGEKTINTKRTQLKTKESLRDSYRRKVQNGEKEAYKPKQKRTKPRTQYFSIFTNDLNNCYITKDTRGVHMHHIFGSSNKENSEKYGFMLPLRADWHNMADYGIHFDKELNLKYKRLCQEYWLEHYGTKEEFINIFKKWW